MSTLEDKILGEKTHNYCSSSESEGEDSTEDKGASVSVSSDPRASYLPEPSKWEGVSSNTGPKGVLKDWQRFKQLEIEQRKEQDEERIALMKKLSLTCKSNLDEERDKQEEDEFAELMSDQFLEEYRKQRMNEMMSSSSLLPKFGTLFSLQNGKEFLDAVDNENKAVTVIVHIYEEGVSGCKEMNKSLLTLSKDYNEVKFCKLISTNAGMSKHFKIGGVPALLIYKAGQAIGTFVRMTDELGDEFYPSDVENFLIEHGMIQDKSCVPKLVSGFQKQDEDSDVSLE